MSYPVQHHSLWYKGDTFIEIMTTDTMLIVRSNHPIFCDGYGCGANNSTRSPTVSPFDGVGASRYALSHDGWMQGLPV